jgi:hypothetical protein
MTDEQRTRLEWIRDGLKWIVGIAAGLLTVSATYFYDRFAQAPRLAPLLWLAWALLVVAAFAGILATLATWKNLGRAEGFGPFLTTLYGAAMWCFTAGFAALAVVLLVNVARSHRPGEVVGLFAARDTLPPFAPASAVTADPRFDVAACAIRRQLAEAGSLAALVVGRADRRELSAGAQARHASNLELAQRRADRVRELLADETLCDARPIRRVVALTSGWRVAPPPGAGGAEADALLAADRRVEVYGFQVRIP